MIFGYAFTKLIPQSFSILRIFHQMAVEGVTVYDGSGNPGTAPGYTITYDPLVDFAYSQVVDVTVDARDAVGNVMTRNSYSFTASAAPTPDVTPSYVEELNPKDEEAQVTQDTNVLFHIKDAGDGVDLTSVTCQVSGAMVYDGVDPGSYPDTTVSGDDNAGWTFLVMDNSVCYVLTYHNFKRKRCA